jgi:hypothetical protein
MMSEDAQALADVSEQAKTGKDGQPDWVTGELPAQYGEIATKIKALQEEADKYEKVAAVLWQTGTPLVLAVRDLFAALQFKTEMSESGAASHDLVVELEGDKRLLMQIVGSDEGMTRKSPHINQILRTLQDDASDKDRVVVVANTHCETPLAQRRQEPVAADALRIIQGLGANVITTPTLFGIWRYSLQDLPGARKSVMRLHAQDGGIFR